MTTSTRTRTSTSTLTLLGLVLALLTVLNTGTAGHASPPVVMNPGPEPVLVSAEVTKVLLPVQTLTTYQWSTERQHAVLRSVWDLPEGMETDTFTASAMLGSTKYCDGTSCVGGSSLVMTMSSPGRGKFASCARSVAGQRLTLDCPITMRKYQESGAYITDGIGASWYRMDGGTRVSGFTFAETPRISARIQNATRIVASVTSIATKYGARSRLVGSVQVLKFSRTNSTYVAKYVLNSDQAVAVTYQDPGGTARAVTAPSRTSTGFAATYPYKYEGTWRISYAGGTKSAPANVARQAEPLVLP